MRTRVGQAPSHSSSSSSSLARTISVKSSQGIAPQIFGVLAVCAVLVLGMHWLATARVLQDKSPLLRASRSPSLSLAGALQTPKLLVALAISITSFGSQSLLDGAAVIAYSTKSVLNQSMYNYELVAFVHPNASGASSILTHLGYRVLITPTPIVSSDIRGKFLREHIDRNGCCGAAELLKLYAYTLIEYYRVVHVDLDWMPLKFFDDILSLNYSLLHTTDVNMAPRHEVMPVQGGFLVIRPSMQEYREIIDIVLEGDFRPGSGWGGKVGYFWGGMTIQGLLPWYYHEFKPGAALAVDRCLHNTMVDTPPCKLTAFDDIVSAHFTNCQKPWSCLGHHAQPLCLKLHAQWLRMRQKAEIYFTGGGAEKPCMGHGAKEYAPIKLVQRPDQ